jgi:hypothetical protein
MGIADDFMLSFFVFNGARHPLNTWTLELVKELGISVSAADLL